MQGRGPKTAKIAVVGEAPGRGEVSSKLPFTGNSGILLTKTISQLGTDPDELWITNSVLCHPVDEKGQNRTPTPDEVACCNPRLIHELKSHSVKSIIAFGTTASNAIAPSSETITKRRGKVVTAPAPLNVPLMPTYHPAYVLRVYKGFPEFSRDIRMGLNLTKDDLPKKPPTRSVLITRTDEAYEVLLKISKLKKGTPLIFDLETTGYSPWLHDILCIALCYDHKTAIVIDAPAIAGTDEGLALGLNKRQKVMPKYQRNLNLLQKILGHTSPFVLVGHNAKFDVKFLKTRWNIDARLDFDTLLGHYAMDERGGVHDLKKIAQENYGAPPYEDDMLQYLPNKAASYREVPRPMLMKYAGFDVGYTHMLHRDLSAQMDDDRKKLLFRVMMPAQNALARSELAGISVDVPYLKKLQKKWEKELEGLIGKAQEAAGDPTFNPLSPKQVAEILYKKLGYQEQRTREDKITTNEAALVALAEKRPHPLLTALLDYRRIAKLKATYVDNLLEKQVEGRIHNEYMLHGTITGRLASRDPNLQNIPRSTDDISGKWVKDSFIASKDMYLLQADYKGAELRALAYFSRDETLLKVFQEGRDIHGSVAAMVYGPNYTKGQRHIAKTIVFGLVYGSTTFTMARRLKISLPEAERFVATFFKAMPATKKWQERTMKEAFEVGFLDTPLGRRRRIPLITPDVYKDLRNQALNFRLQSVAGDLTTLAFTQAQDPISKLGGRVLLTVHDSILCEVPKTKIDQAAAILKKIMIQIPVEWLGPEVPFEVDMEFGEHWGTLMGYEKGVKFNAKKAGKEDLSYVRRASIAVR